MGEYKTKLNPNAAMQTLVEAEKSLSMAHHRQRMEMLEAGDLAIKSLRLSLDQRKETRQGKLADSRISYQTALTDKLDSDSRNEEMNIEGKQLDNRNKKNRLMQEGFFSLTNALNSSDISTLVNSDPSDPMSASQIQIASDIVEQNSINAFGNEKGNAYRRKKGENAFDHLKRTHNEAKGMQKLGSEIASKMVQSKVDNWSEPQRDVGRRGFMALMTGLSTISGSDDTVNFAGALSPGFKIGNLTLTSDHIKNISKLDSNDNNDQIKNMLGSNASYRAYVLELDKTIRLAGGQIMIDSAVSLTNERLMKENAKREEMEARKDSDLFNERMRASRLDRYGR